MVDTKETRKGKKGGEMRFRDNEHFKERNNNTISSSSLGQAKVRLISSYIMIAREHGGKGKRKWEHHTDISRQLTHTHMMESTQGGEMAVYLPSWLTLQSAKWSRKK